MPNPWDGEHDLSAEEVRALIEYRFPDLQAESLELLGKGWDNAAWLVNNSYVFRFPRREFCAHLIAREHALLGHLADKLPLPIPRPLFLGEPAMGYPWQFGGYAHLAGTTACRAKLTPEERGACAGPLGRFLKALHAIPVRDIQAFGLPDDEIRRLDFEYRLPEMRKRMQKLHAIGMLVDPAVYDSIIEEARAAERTKSPPPTVVHGDLYVRHMLVDTERRLCGIIDWGDVHCGTPALDLMLIYGFLPPASRYDFFAEYGAPDPAQLQLARFRALHHGLALAVYGQDIADGDLVREGLFTLDNVLWN